MFHSETNTHISSNRDALFVPVIDDQQAQL